MPGTTKLSVYDSLKKQSMNTINNILHVNQNKLLLVIGLGMAIIIVVVLIVIYMNVKVETFKNGPEPDKMMEAKRPFLNIFDDKGRRTNIVFITHPFSRDDCIETYNKMKDAGCQFLGISSYCEFPGVISNPHDVLHDPKHKAWTYNYFDLTKGWCHCFRNPDEYIPRDFPKILLSESDFANYEKHQPDLKAKKEFDFIYVCLKDNDKCEDGWQSYNRNWEQAQECLDIMCNKFHLKGLLIGRVNCKIPSACHNLMELTDFLEYDKFIQQYKRCRFVFVPNKLDASPRVMTEAICYNMPVLGNYNITGGWKYVTPESGELFNARPGDFEEVLGRFLKNFANYKPREFYMREFAKEKMGKQLLDFCVQTIGWDKMNIKPEDTKFLVPGV